MNFLKRGLKLVLSMSVIAPLLMFGTAAALASPGGSDSSSSTADVSQTPQQAAADLKTRITERETEFKINLNATDKTKVELKCGGAQGILKSLNTRASGITTDRAKAYDALVSKLTDLDTKLKAQKVDTTTLESQIATLKTKIATFNTDLTAYKQALTDITTLDCKSDPNAFKASLEASRTARQKLLADAQDIRTYVNSTIKPTLAAIRKTLEAQKTSSSTGGDN